MVRIIPKRLKPSNNNSANNSAANSRSVSPMRRNMSNPEESKDPLLLLSVIILKARNLAAKDRGGTSDPFLVLTLGDAKHQTHAQPKTLNPEWNELCQFPVSGIESLLLDVCCWDKDRFGKDYMGEFDLALEEIFADSKLEQPPIWFPLKSKRPGKKTSIVSGEVLLQFTLLDPVDKHVPDQQVLDKFVALVKSAPEADPSSRDPTPSMTPTLAPVRSPVRPGAEGSALARRDTNQTIGTNDDDDYEMYDDETPEDEDLSKPEAVEKRKRRLRIKGLKKKKRDNPYEFNHGESGTVGIIFLEIKNITDLPPESNFTRTTFDMDPFVVASLGKKTYRTKTIRHNLHPVYNEKMIFQVQGHEQSYSFAFTVIDRDKYSGNDFIASANLPIKELLDRAPKANPETGLYELPEVAEYEPAKRSRFARLGMSRSASQQSLNKIRPALSKQNSTASQISQLAAAAAIPAAIPAAIALPSADGAMESQHAPSLPSPGLLAALDPAATGSGGPALAAAASDISAESDDPGFATFNLALKMKNLDKWEDKHNPQLYLRAKYMPYPALRQQFWRSMLKQYDIDESGMISRVELTTMLDTLGSTLKESTIDRFFQRFPHKASNGEEIADLTMDEAVICLEDQLEAKSKPQTLTDKMKSMIPDADKVKSMLVGDSSQTTTPSEPSSSNTETNSTIAIPEIASPGEEGEILDRSDDLNDRGEEHVVEIRECPICHQPRLHKRKDTDIITHIATCASQDWRQVNNIVMGGFVTASQAQRKWYSKVITKISYGGYKLGANSANILVQDRITGQINEEKMSVYVRLGIRLLYKGLKSNKMETKRIRKLLKGLSIKQGKKFDDPATRSEIRKFIEFHQLDMSEVLRPINEFANFNEFFYRQLKPEARPCSAPNNPHIIVSPADCRSVVFNRIDAATKIWIKGREFSVKRLLGDAYPEDAKRYGAGAALGIFRLAPQDYHRFHIPVDGRMDKPKLIAGEYYTVNPMAIRSALDVYGENVRVICPIDSEVHGRVMVVCVGAMMVGSTVITRQEGEHVKRAEELGYFKFGGSTIVVLFEEGKMKFDDDLVDNSMGALETLIRAGMSIGHSPSEPQWTPDQRKDESDITEYEKQEAKRRIGGSLGPEEQLSAPSGSSSPDAQAEVDDLESEKDDLKIPPPAVATASMAS